MATYNSADTIFALNDWLGTKRAEVGAGGCASFFTSMPYGNGLTPAGGSNPCPDATEHHFTGKEHDAESGNDYFDARYYSELMGRFMSPDWSAKEDPIPYAKLDDPQSLNLYGYVRNNPTTRVDADGHDGEPKASLWELFKSIFYAKVMGGEGVKAEFSLSKNVRAGFDAFAGVEKKFTTQGSDTSLRAEFGGGIKAPHVPLKPTVGIQKHIETNGKSDTQPAEVYGEDPIDGDFGPASATPNTLSIAVDLPITETISGGGAEVGIDWDKAGEFGAACVQSLKSNAQTFMDFVSPSFGSNPTPQASGLAIPTPATRHVDPQ